MSSLAPCQPVSDRTRGPSLGSINEAEASMTPPDTARHRMDSDSESDNEDVLPDHKTIGMVTVSSEQYTHLLGTLEETAAARESLEQQVLSLSGRGNSSQAVSPDALKETV